jgi:hypothetical protein
MAESASVSRRALDEGYEPEDVRVGSILFVAVASLASLAVIGITLWGVVRWFAEVYPRPLPTALERARIEPPAPRLQPAPKDDLAAFRAREEAILNGWAWVDRTAGVAQIPIERSMALLAERGWPLPDRPDTLVPPRAAGGQDAPQADERSGPLADPSLSPHMSLQEVGPAQAPPQGGLP